MKKHLLLAGLLLLAGAGCQGVTVSTTPSSTSTTSTPSSTTSTTTSTSAAPRLIVNSQKPTTYIVIASATLPEPGFITIQTDAAGTPGAIIASSTMLSTGDHSDIPIRFTPKSRASYWAVLYADDGDGIFSATTDTPVKDAQNQSVAAKFDVQMPDSENPASAASSTTPSGSGTTSTSNPSARGTVNITLLNNAFSPRTVLVKKGARVVFTNRDTVDHTATSDNAGFDSGAISAGRAYVLDTSTLATGTYLYHSTTQPDMRGVIVIE